MQYNISTKKAGVSSFSTEGGVLTTELYLVGNPTSSLEASTKSYVDSKISTITATSITNGTIPIARFPAYGGDITNTAGSNVLTLKSSGVAAGSYPKVTVTNKGIVTQGVSLSADDIPNLTWSKVSIDRPTTLSGFGVSDALSKTGGTMTGFISVMNAPTQTLHAANKSYVDNYSVSSGGSLAVGTIVRMPQITTPVGYLRCNGALVSKTTYPALYAIFGDNVASAYYTISGAGQPWSQQYQTNTTQTTDVTGWTTGTSLPAALGLSSAVVTKNRVYLLGGKTDTITTIATIYTAPINADGTLGAWSSTGVSLPFPVDSGQVAIIKNKLYLFGGMDTGSTSSRVLTCDINADGTLGAWTQSATLPGVLGLSSVLVTKNRVYLLGGYSAGSYVSTVYTAPINSDGTLGAWTTGTSLPGTLGASNIVVTKNRVYLLGGYAWIVDGNYNMNTVYTAPINADGTLGVWANSTTLPSSAANGSVVVTSNKVYLFARSSSESTVYQTTINADGTLGTWTTGTSLPGNLVRSQAVVVKDKVYLLGGFNGVGYVSTVYTAPFTGGLNDYSTFYTSGYTLTDPDNFQLPDYASLESSDFKYYIKY